MKNIPLFERIRAAMRRYEDMHNYTCDVCGREVFGNERLCRACAEALPLHRREICPRCGRSVAEAGVCMECRRSLPAADKMRSAMDHEGEGARLVVRFKTGEKYLFRTLADLMAPLAAREFSDCDLVTSVPMTASARRKRGYDQSRLLAEEIARRSGKPYAVCADKTRETAAQKTLSRAERERNLKGCFRAKKKAVAGKIVLVADDTMTTGSTASELAAALRRAGAAKVYFLTATSVPQKTLPPAFSERQSGV